MIPGLSTFMLIFRSLRHRNYRLFFAGQSISLMGTWIQNIALGWLVYRLTGSAIYLGVIAFAGQIPSLFITPLAGVYADRFNRRITLLITQSLAMLTSIALAIMVLTGIAEIWVLMVMAVIAGVINAFDTPFRHAFVLELVVAREDLSNAIALNSSLYNTARFIGPLIGGLLISLVGEGWCFMINGISFSAAIISLLIIKVLKFEPAKQTGSLFRQLKDGLSYSWDYKPARHLLLLIAVCGFVGLPFQALMPAFASDVLNGGAALLGTLTGSLGAGALTGALYLASRQRMNALPINIFIASLMFAAALALFSQSQVILLSMIALYITGFGMIVMFNATNALLQAISDEDKRGRVISLYSLTFMGMTPLGNLLAGFIAEYSSVAQTVLIASAICLITGLLLRQKITRIRELV
ncbi:MAG: MFS transporter [Bacteroidales bacterium]|nr:MFS transporter [Bacteroidales bacterium]